MKQRTISKAIHTTGIGLHKGIPINMSLEPLDDNMGIVFYRKDKNVKIPLKPEFVVDTTMATVLGKDGVTISTTEHLLSAIHAYGIDNIQITIDNDEVPIMDGSSITYCMLIEEAGLIKQNATKKALKIIKPVEVREGDKIVSVRPNDKTIFDFEIEFAHPAIKKQKYSYEHSISNYKAEIARARTFGFVHEVQYLRSKGLALGGSLQNAIVLDENSVLNKEGLRYKDEFVRHKILDAIGDLALLGIPLIGAYFSYAGGHKLNHLLTKEILGSAEYYEFVDILSADTEVELEYAKAKAIS